MNKIVLLLAGYCASGKSTIAKHLQTNYGFYFIDHQKTIHDLAIKNGFERARFWLKAIGEKDFTRMTTEKILKKTSHSLRKHNAVVLDVVYGTKMVDLFWKNLPKSKIKIIHVKTNDSIRLNYLSKRMNDTTFKVLRSEMRFRDGFLKSTGLDEVIKKSEYVVTNNLNIQKTVDQIIKIVGKPEP
jgi:dephospho-CoA kinase